MTGTHRHTEDHIGSLSICHVREFERHASWPVIHHRSWRSNELPSSAEFVSAPTQPAGIEQLMFGGALMPGFIDRQFRAVQPVPTPFSLSPSRPSLIKVTIERNNSNKSRNFVCPFFFPISTLPTLPGIKCQFHYSKFAFTTELSIVE